MFALYAVVGEDFTADHENVHEETKDRQFGGSNIRKNASAGVRTYLDNQTKAETDFTELNVFERFQPRIPPGTQIQHSFSWETFIPLSKPQFDTRWMESI